MIEIPGFMAIRTGIQVILLLLQDLRDYNVGITDGRLILSIPLRWPQVA
jgi:hypothetical protein